MSTPANKIKIGKRLVGDGEPCFVIAEAGANWKYCSDMQKNYEHALKLIDAAVEARADAVKFQIYRAKKMYPKNAGFADYLKNPKSIYDIIEEMEVPYEWIPKLKNYCDKKGILFTATPFDEQSADELAKVDMAVYKIASYSVSNTPFLSHIAKKGKPIILSTGASDLEDVKKAIKAIQAAGNNQIALMQCTAKYPAPMDTLNLMAIPKMKQMFGVPVGFSDHSRNPIIGPVAAVACGASIIEKHYTSDNNLDGPDHKFAVLCDELKQMVNAIHETEKALGSGEKVVLEGEKELHAFARHRVHSLMSIKKGESITHENVALLRSGKVKPGAEPERFAFIIGKKAKHDIAEGEGVHEADVE
ncbi:MAG: N-acetylneuraminate synthase family protein [Candidatus Micrarchaeota archaeon]